MERDLKTCGKRTPQPDEPKMSQTGAGHALTAHGCFISSCKPSVQFIVKAFMRGKVCKTTVLSNAIAFGFLFRLAASCVQTVQAAPTTENVSPRGTVSGAIVDAKQSPIVGASVMLYRYELGNWRWGYMEEKGAPVASDERGVFQFSNLDNGEYWVAVTHVDFARSICRTRLNQTAKLVAKPAISVVIAVKDQNRQT